jgi:hypothetical protein
MKIPFQNYKRVILGKSLSTFLLVVFSLLACSATAFADTISFSVPTLNVPSLGQQVLYVTLQQLGQAPAGGLVVALESIDTSVAQVPQSVTIPAGSNGAGFYVSGLNPGSTTIYGFNPNFGLISTTVTVGSAQAAQTLTFSPASLTVPAGGQQEMAVILSTPAPAGGMTVLLASTNTFTAQVPVGVTIPANATSAGFFVTGINPGPVQILGFNPSFPLLMANVIVTPPPTSGSIIFSPSPLSLTAGTRGLLFVSLPPLAQAPAGGLTIALGTNNSSVVQLPASITIPAGANGIGFYVQGLSSGTAMIGAFAPPNFGPIFTNVTVN